MKDLLTLISTNRISVSLQFRTRKFTLFCLKSESVKRVCFHCLKTLI